MEREEKLFRERFEVSSSLKVKISKIKGWAFLFLKIL